MGQWAKAPAEALRSEAMRSPEAKTGEPNSSPEHHPWLLDVAGLKERGVFRLKFFLHGIGSSNLVGLVRIDSLLSAPGVLGLFCLREPVP